MTTVSAYGDFLARKRRVFDGVGLDAERLTLPDGLYAWQAHVTRWALTKGRAAIFADCGLGKTFMQTAWAQAVSVPTIILAPLCVAEQTVGEAAKLGIDVRYARTQAEADRHPLVITNYERLDRFDTSRFGAVVLDESSILKAFDAKTKLALVEAFKGTRYRLCCTATPSPNDIAELANHAEFLGLMTRPEFLATWFVRVDQGQRTTTHHGWRMKRHASGPFFRWLSSWALSLRAPSDLGYSDAGFVLPPLSIREVTLESTAPTGDALFPEMGGKGLSGRLAARRTSLEDRIASVKALVGAEPGESWLLWCGLNEESAALAAAIPGAVEVTGSDDYDAKVRAVQGFVNGHIRVLVSKPKILGFGMNFQHCARMAFVGLSDSYEQYYQAIRRCWRYGQTRPVEAHIVVSEAERNVVENVRRKELAAAELSARLQKHMQVSTEVRAS